MLAMIRHCQLPFRPTPRAWMACLALALVPAPASAQDGNHGWPSLDPAKLPTVYVRDHTGTETAGRLLSLGPGSLVIIADGAERRFEAGHVRRIDRRGDSLRNGALTGAAIGVLLGALGTGVADCPGARQGDGCPGMRVVMFLTSTALWTSVGTAIDAAIPGRTPLYVAPSPPHVAIRPIAARRGAGLGLSVRW